MSATAIDHQAIGRSRVALQYQESPKFLDYLRALLQVPNEQEALLQKVALQTDIDEAEGVNLDVLGDIVGASRIVPYSSALQFFGFQGQPGALTFGEEGFPAIGGRFREEFETDFTTSTLDDVAYRVLIRAKIVKNHSKGTNEDVLRGLAYLFGPGVPVAVGDHGGMAIQIAVGRELTFLEQAMIINLDILPRPAGVRISQRVSYDITNFFGFSDQAGALTFGEEDDPAVGGKFAEEF